jgi:uncharacterized protein YehS (DUF1456 family)
VLWERGKNKKKSNSIKIETGINNKIIIRKLLVKLKTLFLTDFVIRVPHTPSCIPPSVAG